MSAGEPLLLTQREAAKAIAVCEKQVYLLAKAGQLRQVRIGRSVRYDRRDIEAFIETAKGVPND